MKAEYWGFTARRRTVLLLPASFWIFAISPNYPPSHFEHIRPIGTTDLLPSHLETGSKLLSRRCTACGLHKGRPSQSRVPYPDQTTNIPVTSITVPVACQHAGHWDEHRTSSSKKRNKEDTKEYTYVHNLGMTMSSQSSPKVAATASKALRSACCDLAVNGTVSMWISIFYRHLLILLLQYLAHVCCQDLAEHLVNLSHLEISLRWRLSCSRSTGTRRCCKPFGAEEAASSVQE